MPETLISIKGLSKTFHIGKIEVKALRDIDVDIHLGEYLAIMGPSGSGKSTLFNMVGALDRPSSGEIRVADVDLTRLGSRELAHFRGNYIGYVFQSYNLIAAYSAEENVAFPLLFSGIEHSAAIKRAREILERVGLGNRTGHRPDELSGGQQQRVAIARALANHPSIVLADEPTANLDLKTGEEIISLLRELCAENGVTVISATHDHKMLAVSDRILWIKDGTVDKLQLRSELEIRTGGIH